MRKWIIHPSYKASSTDNDFAIIKLASHVTFTERVFPVCLPSASTNYDNKVVTVTGWGDRQQTTILQKVFDQMSNYDNIKM